VEAYFTFGRRVFKNETILDPGQQITQSSTNPLSSQMADVVYTDNNIAGFVTGNDTVSITYYDELDYQKGINAIPAGLPMLRHFRLLELNDMTSTKLYSKLIKSVRFKNFSSINNLFINNYDYTFDAQGRNYRNPRRIVFWNYRICIFKFNKNKNHFLQINPPMLFEK
jgi:hypothetical protein